LQTTYGGGISDAFVAKLNPTGSALIYSTYLGGSGEDDGLSIVLGSSGDAYVTGVTDSLNFPTMNPLQSANGGGSDAFVSKINPDGSALIYSTYLGGSGNEDTSVGGLAGAIAVDSTGNAYVTGFTGSTNFPVTRGAFRTICKSPCAAQGNAFVTKINPDGSALVYSTYLGGNNLDYGNGIAVDNAGNSYVTGFTDSSTFPVTPGAFQTTCGGGWCGGNGDAFVTKMSMPAATTTTLTSSPNPSTHGQAVTFTAAVASGLGAPPDGETVTFKKGTTVLGTGTLSGGSASFTTSTLPVGTPSIKAVYGGDSNFGGSTSNVVKQVVN
jgi:hypothetical protein